MTAGPAARAVEYFDLTQYEIEALESKHNLADAHAHQKPSPGEAAVVDALPALWSSARAATQGLTDHAFLDTFFTFHGQHSMVGVPQRSLLSYAASVAMTVVGTYLRLRRSTVTLIEPCFDNLYEILAYNELEVSPVPEAEIFRSPDVYAALSAASVGDALILVDPNNPSGETTFTDGGHRFAEIVRFCADHGRTLILDFSFVAFMHSGSQPGRPDVYEVLDRSGVTYLTIEDTGKTWPTLDIKCGILTASADIAATIRDIHTSVLLNVSPFGLQLLTEFLRSSMADGFIGVTGLLDRNRAAVREAVEGTVLEHLMPTAPVSVAWFRLRTGTATDLQRRLALGGVHVLPGTHFFWSDHDIGESYVRIALARDPDEFARSLAVLRRELLAL